MVIYTTYAQWYEYLKKLAIYNNPRALLQADTYTCLLEISLKYHTYKVASVKHASSMEIQTNITVTHTNESCIPALSISTFIQTIIIFFDKHETYGKTLV